VITPGDDPLRTYTQAEDKRLAKNLEKLTAAVHRGEYSTRLLDQALLCEVHGALFEGVRAHAGRTRRQHHGSERLIFGPNRSVHRDHVEAELRALFDRFQKSFASFVAHPDDPAYEESAIHVAVWLHAELIRIHPFEDGNGRSGRLFMGAALVALGLRPIPIEACKQEYYDCLNHYMRAKDLTYLQALYIRLYPDS
jgi:fido (protein-threonine AMPylation protein)